MTCSWCEDQFEADPIHHSRIEGAIFCTLFCMACYILVKIEEIDDYFRLNKSGQEERGA